MLARERGLIDDDDSRHMTIMKMMMKKRSPNFEEPGTPHRGSG